MLKLLADGESREEIVSGILTGSRGSAVGNVWSNIGSEANKHLEGMSFEDAAAQRGTTIEDMMCQVMLEESSELRIPGRTSGEHARVATGRGRHHGTDAASRLHGGVRRDPNGWHGAPESLRMLPTHDRSIATYGTTFLWNSWFKGCRRTRLCASDLRTAAKLPEGKFADIVVFDARSDYRSRYVRRSGAIPRGYSIRSSQWTGGSRPREAHRSFSRRSCLGVINHKCDCSTPLSMS